MGVVLNLIAYAITLLCGVKGKTLWSGFIWLTVVAVVNTIPVFLLEAGDPRLATLFPNTAAHFVIFGAARLMRRLFRPRADKTPPK